MMYLSAVRMLFICQELVFSCFKFTSKKNFLDNLFYSLKIIIFWLRNAFIYGVINLRQLRAMNYLYLILYS